MQYLKIKSRSVCDRELLELLGASLSRDDDAKVGMFGSGAKFAPIALLKLRHKISVFSCDEKGSYKLEYGVRRDKHQRIFFKYTDPDGKRSRVNSSYTIHMGLNWIEGIDENKTWKGVREFIANAEDADPFFHPDSHMEVVTEVPKLPTPNTQETSVYISMTPDLKKLVDNLDDYYAYSNNWKKVNHLGAPSRIRKQRGEKKTRIFVKKYLVEVIDYPGLFDYDLYDPNLVNEERTMKNSFQRDSLVAKALFSLEDESHLKHFLTLDLENQWEGCLMGYHGRWIADSMEDEEKERYRDAFFSKFGERAVVKSMFQNISEDARNLGYKVIDLPYVPFASILPNAEEATNLQSGFKIVEENNLPSYERKILKRAKEILEEEIPLLSSINVSVFKSISPEQEHLNGVVMDGEIMLNQKRLSNGLGSTLKTLFHEINHIQSGASDYSRELQTASDDMVASLLLRVYEGD